MYRISLLVLGLIVLVTQSCQNEQELLTPAIDISDLQIMPKGELNELIYQRVRDNNGPISWSELSDNEIASALNNSEEKIIYIGWNADQPKGKDVIINYIRENETDSGEELIFEIDDELHSLYARIQKIETLIGLRYLGDTRVLNVMYDALGDNKEASIYDQLEEQNQVSNKNGGITPYKEDVVRRQNIHDAWNAGLDGDNITVAVLDNGVLRDDPIFGEGKSYSGRSIKREGYYTDFYWWPWARYDGPWAKAPSLILSHGTGMMKNVGAPQNSSEGAGIAFNSDVIIVRSANSILLDRPSASVGVSRSFKAMAKNSRVKIISMSQGAVLFEWSNVKDAIRYAYSKQKMIFTAAGTFPAGQILDDLIGNPNLTLFPASMSEVHGVTGILPPLANNINLAVWCEMCFGQADFVVEFDLGITKGSSSVATSSLAAMAAQIWATNPSMSRNSVYTKLRQSADRYNKSDRFWGHGRIDMKEFVTENNL